MGIIFGIGIISLFFGWERGQLPSYFFLLQPIVESAGDVSWQQKNVIYISPSPLPVKSKTVHGKHKSLATHACMVGKTSSLPTASPKRPYKGRFVTH